MEASMVVYESRKTRKIVNSKPWLNRLSNSILMYHVGTYEVTLHDPVTNERHTSVIHVADDSEVELSFRE